jgi:hypothetical protein
MLELLAHTVAVAAKASNGLSGPTVPLDQHLRQAKQLPSDLDATEG